MESWKGDGKKARQREKDGKKEYIKEYIEEKKHKRLTWAELTGKCNTNCNVQRQKFKGEGITFDSPNIKYNIHSGLSTVARIDTNALYLVTWGNKFYICPIAHNHSF